MKKIFEYLIAYLMKSILWFRYRIKVEGLDKLTAKTLNQKGGVIFMPNHPTYFIDPIIVVLSVWPKFSIRPMIVEYMYYSPIIYHLMHFMNAIPIPNFVSSSNSLKRKKSEKVIQTVVDDLKKGQNFLIYPAGKVKQTAYESIGGASAVHRIIEEAPEANIVLVRIKGLWGSSFSRTLQGAAPELSEVLWKTFILILKNLIFFMPRREVIVELMPAPEDFPRNSSRLEMNKYLELWYNRPDGLTKQKEKLPGDSLILVSYSMWGEKYFPVRDLSIASDQDISVDAIPDDIKNKVIQKLAELKECAASEVKPEMNLATDLGLDSLDLAEVIVFLQDQFNIEGIPPNELTTVAKVMAISSGQITVHEDIQEEKRDFSSWNVQIPKQRVQVAEGDTIPEVFLNQCRRAGKSIACADRRVGIQTFAQLKLRVILIAEYLRKLPGDYIGIMLPASVAANLLILASQLAGKIPLMINWTVGPRHLESVVQLSSVQTVISSWAFLDRLDNVDLNGIENKILMLEDVIREITLFDKLKAFLRAKKGTKSLLKIFEIDKKNKADMAVLLFTSGTESLPKGVPLSHENILSNQRAALIAVPAFTDDIIFGFLPPFHSFGFTISGILGLLAGIRVVYFPDPTDGKRLANEFAAWRMTIMCGAPTFIKGMLKAATANQIKTMRLCVTGAEKAPPELFEMFATYGKPGCLVEGYGITECAPVLTMNSPEGNSVGVGKPLQGIELCIVNPETEYPLPIGERGLILVKGPNVFNGYLNPGLSSPFKIINGERWYKTGDIGYLDSNGNLTISDRMKRFVKLGAEMISLASIEDALSQISIKKGWMKSQEAPSLAICAKEISGEKTKIFLFSKFNVSIDEANKSLKESGFSNLVRIFSVTTLPEIPVMGTGKINYRLLESEYLKS